MAELVSHCCGAEIFQRLRFAETPTAPAEYDDACGKCGRFCEGVERPPTKEWEVRARFVLRQDHDMKAFREEVKDAMERLLLKTSEDDEETVYDITVDEA